MQSGIGEEAQAGEGWDTAMLKPRMVKYQLRLAARALGADDTEFSRHLEGSRAMAFPTSYPW